MKQVININFQGSVVPIEEAAYGTLKNYLDSLRRYFQHEEGSEEIINDIEARIGELFSERLKTGANLITEEDIEAIKRSIGTPEDLSGASAAEENTNSSATNTAWQNQFNQKRFFRNENDKILGGVCSGIANYLNIDTSLVRVVFAILFFAFGVGLIPYILLWIIVPSSSTLEIGSLRKRLYRDLEDKVLGGVCSGIAHYFNIQSWIVRLLFVLPLISIAFRYDGFPRWGAGFNFSSIIIYIILWIIIPEARSTSERLEMKGEKVDLNSIKNSRTEELKFTADRIKDQGRMAADAIKTNSQHVIRDIEQSYYRNRSTAGSALGDIVRVIGKIILAIISFFLLIMLFSLTVASIGIFPLKEFLLKGTTQNLLAWGTLIFFIAVPLIGLITWITRKLAKLSKGSKQLRASFIILWIFGWVCFIGLIASVSRDFKYRSRLQPEEIALTAPTTGKLTLTADNKTIEMRRSRIYFNGNIFAASDLDSLFVGNIRVNVLKSPDSLYRLTKVLAARGGSRVFADTSARAIDYNIIQQDSMLQVDRGILINRTDKFRNQNVELNIYVPVGKKIRMDASMKRLNSIYFNGRTIRDNDWDYENAESFSGWDYNKDYIMTENGLQTLDGKKAGSDEWIWDDGQKETIDTIAPKPQTPSDIRRQLDSLKRIEERLKDSLIEEQKRIKEQLNESVVKESTASVETSGTETVSPTLSFLPIPVLKLY